MPRQPSRLWYSDVDGVPCAALSVTDFVTVPADAAWLSRETGDFVYGGYLLGCLLSGGALALMSVMRRAPAVAPFLSLYRFLHVFMVLFTAHVLISVAAGYVYQRRFELFS